MNNWEVCYSFERCDLPYLFLQSLGEESSYQLSLTLED